MSRPRIIALIFALVALVQLAIPASLVMRYERTMHQGKVFKFRTAPVDPADAFRGRYVALGYDNTELPWTEKETPAYNSRVFALIETGADGFAKFTSAMSQKPASGDYVSANASGVWKEKINIRPTFDRFYMEENAAPLAENVYRKHNPRGGTRDAYVVVRVLDGTAVIEQSAAGKPWVKTVHSVGAPLAPGAP